MSMNSPYRWEMCCRWLCRGRLRTWLSKWRMFHMLLPSCNVLPFLALFRNFRASSFSLFFSMMKLGKLLPHGLLSFSWVHVHVTGYGSVFVVNLILTSILFVKPGCIVRQGRDKEGRRERATIRNIKKPKRKVAMTWHLKNQNQKLSFGTSEGRVCEVLMPLHDSVTCKTALNWLLISPLSSHLHFPLKTKSYFRFFLFSLGMDKNISSLLF